MLDLDKLLAVKVFYYGMLSAKNVDSRRTAITMLGSAVEQLTTQVDDQSRLRLAFYYLVRAELHRYEGDPVPDRQAAQNICESINRLLYLHVLDVVANTTTLTHGPKRTGLLSAYGSTSTAGAEAEHSDLWWLEFSLRALGESLSSLTDVQKNFIEHKSLLDLFKKHSIQFAP